MQMTQLPIENSVRSISTVFSKWLASQSLAPSVAKLDFKHLKHKYTQSVDAEMTESEWDFDELEYRRFLTLKVLYPNAVLVPNKAVDTIWHAHILDTRAYRQDCDQVFGHFIDHYPYFGIYGEEDYQNLKNAFLETVTLYEIHFGEYPNKSSSNAMRCGDDHACHVPSSCACRVEGACK
ncbi:MAG TPA: hypothetical protein VK958_08640 [Methylophilus sp.]|uniref:glycine-rich domain-containing protein n=1 Tax=Methylophilus sp. TaxID=29541 RepID=UPI002B8FE36C|nr:hypothetical protein [Methylophilus sp.]HSH87298.1 hypothetical protein [Methylophilus sp.]